MMLTVNLNWLYVKLRRLCFVEGCAQNDVLEPVRQKYTTRHEQEYWEAHATELSVGCLLVEIMNETNHSDYYSTPCDKVRA
jgi:nitric oxide synthase oxygenase domain/subunit